MTRRFGLRFVITLLLVTVVVSGAALAAGRAFRQPDDHRALLLAWCETAPCIMDIVPGETGWAQTTGQISRLPDSQLYPKQIVTRFESVALEFYPSINQGAVGRIFLHFAQDHQFDAGWVIQRFGEPCGVSLYPTLNQATLRYRFLLANVQVEQERLQPRSAVLQIVLTDPHFQSDSQPDPCVDNITSRQMLNSLWQGFSTIGYYRAHQHR
ncbi:MAG: hypothetical protein IT320_18285 [Anaerolineae bacterium]|nr:hypothetical protein [Anaerolineae bacterium]